MTQTAKYLPHWNMYLEGFHFLGSCQKSGASKVISEVEKNRRKYWLELGSLWVRPNPCVGLRGLRGFRRPRADGARRRLSGASTSSRVSVDTHPHPRQTMGRRQLMKSYTETQSGVRWEF